MKKSRRKQQHADSFEFGWQKQQKQQTTSKEKCENSTSWKLSN